MWGRSRFLHAGAPWRSVLGPDPSVLGQLLDICNLRITNDRRTKCLAVKSVHCFVNAGAHYPTTITSGDTILTELSLSGVEKAYGEIKVLHDIHLSIESREFVVFVGPSGCGKSTLLRCIAGLES